MADVRVGVVGFCSVVVMGRGSNGGTIMDCNIDK